VQVAGIFFAIIFFYLIFSRRIFHFLVTICRSLIFAKALYLTLQWKVSLQLGYAWGTCTAISHGFTHFPLPTPVLGRQPSLSILPTVSIRI